MSYTIEYLTTRYTFEYEDNTPSITSGFVIEIEGGGVTDHGALTGLGDDDHTQYAKKASNLSDLTSASTARTNLGLGTAATAASTDFATAAQGTNERTPTDGSVTNAKVNASAAIDLSKLQTITTARLLGRSTAGTGAIEQLTAAQVRSLIGMGWVVLHNVTLGSDAGTSASPLSYDVTGYSLFRVTFYGNGTRGSTTEGLRMGINSETGNVYSTDTAALTSAWFVATIPGSSTNTDRIAQVSIEFGGISGSMKSGRSESTNIGSTASVGAADVDAGLFSTITAAVTSIQLYGANAALRAGSRIIIEGLA